MFKNKTLRKSAAGEKGTLTPLALGIVILVVFLDQLSKYWISQYLYLNEYHTVFPGFDLILRHNTGAAFSFLDDAGGWQRWFFIITAIFMCMLMIIWIWNLHKSQKLEGIALSLILGGALGNLWDRVAHGYVIDFILLYYKDLPPWPAFNIADSAICVGVFLFIVDFIRQVRKNKK